LIELDKESSIKLEGALLVKASSIEPLRKLSVNVSRGDLTLYT
jgi:hypothetical protein